MRAALQAGILPKGCIPNPEIPTLGSWGWENISEKWVLKRMSFQKLLKHVSNHQISNEKTCAGDSNVLIKTYLALNYVDVHVKNSYRIKIIVHILKLLLERPHKIIISFYIFRILVLLLMFTFLARVI